MNTNDVIEWLCANFDRTNATREQEIWKVTNHLISSQGAACGVEVLHMPTGAVYSIKIDQVRSPVSR